MTNAADMERQRARQKTIITVLACLLIVAGAVVLFFLRRMPLPLRMLVGLGDVAAGIVLLVVARPRLDA